MGSHLSLFIFYIFHYLHFLWISNYYLKSALISPEIFYPLWRELMEFSPMGSDLSFVIFNIFSYLHFLYLKLYKWNRPFFFTRDFLYIDGWDGTDGRSTFFFCPIPWKLLDIFFIINPGPFNEGFSTSFRIFGEKHRNVLFFLNFAKIKNLFLC